jgi:hypothetical protein
VIRRLKSRHWDKKRWEEVMRAEPQIGIAFEFSAIRKYSMMIRERIFRKYSKQIKIFSRGGTCLEAI